MPKYRVFFREDFEASTQKECYEHLLDYLFQCAEHDDATGFRFRRVER